MSIDGVDFLEGLYLWEDDYVFDNQILRTFGESEAQDFGLEIREVEILDHKFKFYLG